jgi:RNA polymerase sigma-70 factor (ECF subfamily)
MKRYFKKSNPYLSDPDVQRMLDVQRGSKIAFEALMRHYYPRILNFIYRFVGNQSTAEDLTQEVFMRVYNNARKYRPKSGFQTWIYTIAKNVALNDLRRGRRLTFFPDEPADGDGHKIYKESEDLKVISPDEKIIQKEKAVRIRAAISKLPENQKIALILRRYEEFSYAEIAATLNVSDKAVKSLLSRAMQNLKNRLAGQTEAD